MVHSYLLLLLVFLISNSSSQSMAQTTDQEILLAIKKAWGSPSALSSWSSQNTSYCIWAGVTCNNNNQVTKLSFPNFNISNPIPAFICSLKNLSYLDLSYNNLTDQFPTVLYGCSALSYLDLSNNLFSGALPADMGKLSSEMEHLNLSSNLISGEIPAEIGFLPVLNMLDLSNNQLTGDIPQEFDNLRLSFLNLSSNQLTGELPQSLQSPAYDKAFLGNRGLCAMASLNLNIPACPYREGSQMKTGLIILFSLVAGVLLIGAAGCFVIRRRTRERDLTTWKVTPFCKLDFTESDILTKLREENVIGSGGSGKVYRVPLRGGAVAAVKKLCSRGTGEEKVGRDFDSEVRILGDIRHANIVSLLCYISSDDTKLLVYEYMENGSLDRWLRPAAGDGVATPLDWPTRLGIAIDAARGLSDMHQHHECAQPIMHRDVKSSNILLDRDCRAKILADVGLARILVNSGEPESASVASGTFGYIAPERESGAKVNEEVDVYNFGVVLLELVTGRAANDGADEWCLVEWAWRRYKEGGPLHDVVDGRIRDSSVHLRDAMAVFQLGVTCTGEDPASRPSMKQVLEQLLQYERTANDARAQLPKRDLIGKLRLLRDVLRDIMNPPVTLVIAAATWHLLEPAYAICITVAIVLIYMSITVRCEM